MVKVIKGNKIMYVASLHLEVKEINNAKILYNSITKIDFLSIDHVFAMLITALEDNRTISSYLCTCNEF